MSDYDAIIIGAGHNGLVAALYLSKAGWRTLVLERNPRIGGAVQSGEVTLPGFVHDLYSTNQNLFLASPVYKELQQDLERHGLRYRVSDYPYSSLFPDGKSLRVYRDVERTMEMLRAHNPEDLQGWQRLYNQFKRFRQHLLPVYGMPIQSLKAAWAGINATRSLGLQETLELAQILLSSTRELGQAYFASDEVRTLVATWGMHLDFGPDVSGGSMFPFIETFSDMEAGMAIAEGGASRMVEALAGLVRENGGEIRTESEVVRIVQEGSRVVAVELKNGEQISAGKAIIANLTPTILFQHLLVEERLPKDFRQDVRQYEYGPGTMMVHLALSGKPQWAARESLADFAYVHIAPYIQDLAQTYAASLNGYLPESPLLVVGQTSVVDPSRAPGDQQVLWIQVRALPAQVKGDMAGEIEALEWDEIKEAYADRVLEKLEQYAPGVRGLILDRAVFSPIDLQRHDPNLHGGDSVSGSHHLRQNFLWRPVPGWADYRMPLEGLYMVGAATWPGAGTNAISGYLAARQILGEKPVREKLLRGGLVAGSAAAIAIAIARLIGEQEDGDGARKR